MPPHPVVVYACGCEQKWDRQAEYFRNTLIAMIDRGAHPKTDALLEGPVLRSLKKPNTLAAMIRGMRLQQHKSAGGIFTGYRPAFQIDLQRFSAVPEKIVRGLFFLKSGRPLATTHKVHVFPGNGFWNDTGFQSLLACMEPSAGCGDDVFHVRSMPDSTDPYGSAWLLVFYSCMALFALTAPEHHDADETNARGQPD